MALTQDEIDFFDRAKRTINNKNVYNEFLKIINLHNNEILDTRTLVERVEPFLSKNPDLFEFFKRMVKYQDEEIIYNIVALRPPVDLKSCRRTGHSYRLLPKHIDQPGCSGRDTLCNEVMNDRWVSHPIFNSEDSGFQTHKKNQHEEALHKIEEERFEFDINIEANLHSIQLLENVLKRIEAMPASERSLFRWNSAEEGALVFIPPSLQIASCNETDFIP